MDSLSDFEIFEFSHDGLTRSVYRSGTGPAVVVMHEVPGITPLVAKFARNVRDTGFTVFLPSLLGTPGKPPSISYAVEQLGAACVRREFHVLASNRSSPITNYLRALAKHAFGECGGLGVGALGMCLTGNFALSMVLEPSVVAPVLCQPSLPFAVSLEKRSAIHVSPEELNALKRRTQNEGLTVLGMRFTKDPSCPKARFDTLSRQLGDAFERIEIESSTVPNTRFPSGPHSVVTEDLIDEEGHPTKKARDRVLEFFKERLIS